MKLLRHARRLTAASFLALVASTTNAAAHATGGFFGGLSLGHEYADVDYAKSAGIAVPPASSAKSRDDEGHSVGAFGMTVGYRRFLTDRVYLSGEVEGTLYFNERVNGLLRGTGTGDRDVWPGAWSFEKNHRIGFNARLGYVPAGLDFLGAGRSVYLLSGVHWLDTTFDAAHDNGAGISGNRRKDRGTVPWLIGAGLEFGSVADRFDLRFRYTGYDVDFGTGDGQASHRPKLEYDFDVDEWGIYLGYTRSFGFGMGGRDP